MSKVLRRLNEIRCSGNLLLKSNNNCFVYQSMDLSENDCRQILSDIFLKDPLNQPLYALPTVQRIIEHKPSLENLYHVEVSPLVSRLVFERDIKTGDLLECQEVFNDDDGDDNGEADANTATTSMSLQRRPVANTKDIATFNATSLPFKPATVDHLTEREKLRLYDEESSIENTKNEAEDDFIDFDNLLKQPPGIDTFLDEKEIPPDVKELFTLTPEKESLFFKDLLEGFNLEVPSLSKGDTKENNEEPSNDVLNEIDDVLKIEEMEHETKAIKSTKWAIAIDISKIVSEEEFNSQVPYPAFKYPFELDTFQKQAILALEKHQNVFVAAHTSAGKTVVAEYAIAMSIRRNLTRVVYTSPIKALSNQKFRDFRQVFGTEEVGLLTGDVQIRKEASCLIMTTEILLQMLYNGSELIRDLEWVIFDEVHYVNDKERGHVWEEVFILLPEHIKLVLLSATIGNFMDFADWLGATRKRKFYVIYTTQRPVPLEHYLYTGSNAKTMNECFLFVDSKGKFIKSGYEKAVDAKKSRETKFQKNFGPKQKNYTNPQAQRNTYITLIRYLEKAYGETNVNKLPVIVFTFSRKRCFDNACMLAHCMDLTTNEEKGLIQQIINRSLMKLKKTDRKIPQVEAVSFVLKKGFGIHHSGVLPLLKEITEILFDKGLVRVLFATETFAMGVNMPARTVCFESIEKYDSNKKRNLYPSEYIQMAGRAGRRGKDKTGTVIVLCLGDVPELSDLHSVALGKPAALDSQFRLTYSMILNVLRSRHRLRVESVMEKSFVEHQQQVTLVEMKDRAKALKKAIAEAPNLDCPNCSDLDAFATDLILFGKARENILPLLFGVALDDQKLALFKNGRLLLFESDTHPFLLAAVLGSKKYPRRLDTEIHVLAVDPMPFIASDGDMEKIVVSYETIEFRQIQVVFKHHLPIDGQGVLSEKSLPPRRREKTVEFLQKLWNFFLKMNHQLPISSIPNLFMIASFDCIQDFHIRNITEFIEPYNEYLSLRTKLLSYDCLGCESFLDHLSKAKEKVKLRQELKVCEANFSPESLCHYVEYQERLQVLKTLNYINDEECLEMKGKVACLMSQHELVITEMLAQNILGDSEPEEIAALMSAFVFQEKVDKVPTFLHQKQEQLKKLAFDIATLEKSCQMYIVPEDSVSELKFGLVEVVYHWAKGVPFAEVMKLTQVQEGIIVRCIQRLDELFKDVREAAKLFGDHDLVRRFDDISNRVRRDIVFAGSLYVQSEL